MNPHSSSASAAPSRPLLDRRFHELGRIFVFIAAFALPLGQVARAATDTWSTSPGTGAWSTAANWSDAASSVPASNDSLVFGASTITSGTDDLMTPGTYNVAGITFNSGAPAYTITSGTAGVNGFTLTGNITNSSTSLDTINDLIATTAVRTITMTSGGGNVTLGGNISGAGGGFTTATSGTLTLSGSNSFTGATTVSPNTTLQLQANSGNTVSGTSYALGATSLSMGKVNSSTSTLQLRSDSSLTFNGGNGLGGLGGGNGGGETITIDVNNLGTNGDTATSGTLTFAPGGISTDKTTINVAGGNGYTLALGPINALSAALTLNPSSANLIVGNISAGNTLTEGGTGTLILAGSNSISSTFSMGNGATLQLQANSNNTVSGTSYALGAAYGNFKPAAGSETIGIQLRSDSSVTFSGLAGIGNLNGATVNFDVNNLAAGLTNGATDGGPQGNTLSFFNNFTYLGTANTFNITGGDGYTLAFGPMSDGAAAVQTFNATGASATIASYTDSVSGGTLALTGSSTGNFVLGGISGTSLAVTKSGPGTWTILSNGNSYTGATKVLAGTLIVSGSLSGTTAVSATTGGILEVDGSVNEADIIAVNGSVLRGNGLIGGATLVSGTLSPGYNSTLGTQVTGTMTSAASVSLDSNSVFAVRLGLAASGTDSDMLALTSGTATLGNAQLQLTLGSNFANAAVGTMYAIITDTASTTDISGQFAQGGTITVGGDTFNILYNENATGTGSGDDVVLDLAAAVPEPGTWASMLVGMGMLVAFQRMRRRNLKTHGSL